MKIVIGTIRSVRNVFACILLVCFCACTTSKYAYTPSTANLLQVEQKGDFKAAVNYATATGAGEANGRKSSNGIDLQTVYAVSKRLSVKADGYFKGEGNQTIARQASVPNEVIRYKKKGAEISLGSHNFSRTKDRSSFQAFIGAGTGKFSFNSKYNDGRAMNSHSMDYFKLFLQPSYTFFVSKNYYLTFGSKISMLQFSNVVTNYPNLNTTALGYIDTKPNYYVDFILQQQFGFTQLKGMQFQFQIGFTNLATSFTSEQNNLLDEKYDYNNSWIALGLMLDVSKMRNK